MDDQALMLALLYVAAGIMLAFCLWLLYRWDTAEPAFDRSLGYLPTLKQLAGAAIAGALFLTLAIAILTSLMH